MILQQINRHTSREDVDWIQRSPFYDVFELGIVVNDPPDGITEVYNAWHWSCPSCKIDWVLPGSIPLPRYCPGCRDGWNSEGGA